jgi:hypothetical protein
MTLASDPECPADSSASTPCGSASCDGADPGRAPSGRSGGTALLGPLACGFVAILLLSGCGLFGDDGDTTPPPAPTGLSAASEPGASALQWSAPQAEDLAGYKIYRSTDDPIDVQTVSPLNADSLVSSTSFTDQSVTNGTTYRYRVTAVDDSDNESSPSDSARVTPFADPPPRP